MQSTNLTYEKKERHLFLAVLLLLQVFSFSGFTANASTMLESPKIELLVSSAANAKSTVAFDYISLSATADCTPFFYKQDWNLELFFFNDLIKTKLASCTLKAFSFPQPNISLVKMVAHKSDEDAAPFFL